MWNEVVSKVPIDTILYQTEGLLDTLANIDESTYPIEACRIRDILELIVDYIKCELFLLKTNPVHDPVSDARARKLGQIVQKIYSYVRFLQASDPRKTPPAVQSALSALTQKYFPVTNPAVSPITLVRPQWGYNLTYRPLSNYLRSGIQLADLDPDNNLGATNLDEAIEKLAERKKATAADPLVVEKYSNLSKSLAVLSFAGLDADDTLMLPILCHELGHFIDYGRDVPLAGDDPADDRFALLSASKSLVAASTISRNDLKLKIEGYGHSVDILTLNKAHTVLLGIIQVHPAEARAGVEGDGHADSNWSCVKGSKPGGQHVHQPVVSRLRYPRLPLHPHRLPGWTNHLHHPPGARDLPLPRLRVA